MRRTDCLAEPSKFSIENPIFTGCCWPGGGHFCFSSSFCWHFARFWQLGTRELIHILPKLSCVATHPILISITSARTRARAIRLRHQKRKLTEVVWFAPRRHPYVAHLEINPLHYPCGGATCR